MADVISVLGGNWTDAGAWNDASVPTAADDVSATGAPTASGNVVLTTGAVCRSADFTNYESTLSGNATLTLGDGTAGAGNVALKLAAGMTISGFPLFTFVSTSGTQQSITMAGKTIQGFIFNGAGGSWVFSDAINLGSNSVTLTAGSLSDGGQTVSAGSFGSSNSNVRSLTMTGAWSFSVNSGTVWNADTATNFTLTATSSTINLTSTGGSDKTFAGGGLTYGTVNISSGGAGAWTFTGSNTFSKINRSGTGTKTVKFTDGTTTTLTGGSGSFMSGTAGNLWTITGTSTGGWTISTASAISIDYVNLSYCTVTGGGSITCGVNSVNGGNNGANVVFLSSGPPVGTMAMLGVGK